MGYRAVCVDGAPKTGLLCVHCSKLLRSPVQTEDGQRLCKTCFSSIKDLPGRSCDDCEVTLVSDQYYPDRAVEREVMALVVWCQYKSLGCCWQGKLQDLESHIKDCIHKGVNCPHEGCDLTLPQSGLAEHTQVCPHRLVKCDHCSVHFPQSQKQVHESKCEEIIIKCEVVGCGLSFPRKKLRVHQEEDCVVVKCLTCGIEVERSTGCERVKESSTHRGWAEPSPLAPEALSLPANLADFKVSPASYGSVHLAGPLQNLQHHQQLAGRVQEIEGVVSEVRESSRKEVAAVAKDMEKIKEENATFHVELSEVKIGLAEARGKLNDYASTQLTVGSRHGLKGDGRGVEVSSGRGLDVLRSQVEGVVRAEQEREKSVRKMMREMEELKQDLTSAKTGRDFKWNSGGAYDSSSPQTRLLEELQKQFSLMKVQLSDLELQLQASLASTYNGSLLWRIPDLTRRRRDAIDGRVTSIYSPPFYTGRNGYKMCIRGYLNGDGMGYQSHLSLFFVIMRGECDPLLKWPFEYKVSMILVDQTHRRHIVQTFKPTPESNSFQQPKTELNVASGCPQFAKLSVFDDPSYVKDDVMYIKCIVDTTKIFHP